jgi:uncharacterized membrane protein (TIGR02234 family)
MTSGRESGRLSLRSPRQELTLALLLGAVGAGLLFLATRQGWAQVRTRPPRPMPASVISVTGAALVPYADALALASLASLAAILASRRLLRRLTGLLLAALGASLAASVLSLSPAGAIAAANGTASPAGAGAGSVTQGSNLAPTAIPNVAGATSHVAFAAAGWQVMAVTGAILMVAAGILVAWRADRMAVMSSRYDAPTGPARSAPDQQAASDQRGPASRGVLPGTADSASVWEALSRGDDPTSAGHSPAGT